MSWRFSVTATSATMLILAWIINARVGEILVGTVGAALFFMGTFFIRNLNRHTMVYATLVLLFCTLATLAMALIFGFVLLSGDSANPLAESQQNIPTIYTLVGMFYVFIAEAIIAFCAFSLRAYDFSI